jgi:hypothetical protein
VSEAALDQIFTKISSMGGVLFVARQRGRYQSGCGAGRPSYSHAFLLVHPTGERNEGAWTLPSATDDIGQDALLDVVPNGDVLIARVEAEFNPAVSDSEMYDKGEWLHAAFVVNHPWCRPEAQRAVQNFIRENDPLIPTIGSEPQTTGVTQMESRTEFSDAQEKADKVARVFGDSAPPPMNGERLFAYRQRLARQYQTHSRHKSADLSKIGCSNAFGVIEGEIYLDAQHAATHPKTGLHAFTAPDPSGRPITKYAGADGACWDQFNPPYRHVRRFLTPGTKVL